jgi:hypothetical protein
VRVRGALSIALLCSVIAPFHVCIAAAPKCARLPSNNGTDNRSARSPLRAIALKTATSGRAIALKIAIT